MNHNTSDLGITPHFSTVQKYLLKKYFFESLAQLRWSHSESPEQWNCEWWIAQSLKYMQRQTFWKIHWPEVMLFPHSDWIRRDTEYLCKRDTLKGINFHESYFSLENLISFNFHEVTYFKYFARIKFCKFLEKGFLPVAIFFFCMGLETSFYKAKRPIRDKWKNLRKLTFDSFFDEILIFTSIVVRNSKILSSSRN